MNPRKAERQTLSLWVKWLNLESICVWKRMETFAWSRPQTEVRNHGFISLFHSGRSEPHPLPSHMPCFACCFQPLIYPLPSCKFQKKWCLWADTPTGKHLTKGPFWEDKIQTGGPSLMFRWPWGLNKCNWGWISSSLPPHPLPMLVPLFQANIAKPDSWYCLSFPHFLLLCLNQWFSKYNSRINSIYWCMYEKHSLNPCGRSPALASSHLRLTEPSRWF